MDTLKKDKHGPVLEVLSTGSGMSIQDAGRPGWKRFGIPCGGAMDLRSAKLANKLVGNHPRAPVLEILQQGARLRVLREVVMAVGGGNFSEELPAWTARRFFPGEVVSFTRPGKGVWTYLAVEGGFYAPLQFGGRGAYVRAGIGISPLRGDKLHVLNMRNEIPRQVAVRRFAEKPPLIPGNNFSCQVFEGPHWDLFSKEDRMHFFAHEWTVSLRRDRNGYRLEGTPLTSNLGEIPSEPMMMGAVQIPPNGLPIVLMRDGPTVGGYPVIAIVPEKELSFLAQACEGSRVCFQLIDKASWT